MNDQDRVEALLLDIGRKLDRLLAAQGVARKASLSEQDIRDLTILLPAIHGAVDTVVWSVGEDLLSGRFPAISEALSKVARSPKALGKLLSRAESTSVAGYRVVKAKRLGGMVLWCVERDQAFQVLSKHPKPAGA